MGSSNQPDVRVRLSAEGVQDVVAAFQKISAEAEKAGRKGQGVGLLSDSFRELKSLAGGLSIAAAVGGIIALGKSALDNADRIGKLSQKVGVSTEMLSVFSLAATTADVEQEALAKGLEKLALAQDNAAKGSQKQLDSFERLHISMQQIKTLNPGEMFLLIANRLQDVTSASGRAAIAQNLLSKSGAELIPLMNDLANGGYDVVAAKAARMGLIVDSSLAKSAQAAHDDITDMQNMAKGLATQFLAGLAPDVAQAMESFTRSVTGDGPTGGLRKLGEYAGKIARGIVAAFQIAGATVADIWVRAGRAFDGFQTGYTTGSAAGSVVPGGSVLGGLISGVAGARAANDPNNPDVKATTKVYQDQLAQIMKDFESPASGPSSHSDKLGGADNGGGNLEKVLQARLALLKAAADNELSLTKARNLLVGQANERSYKDGTTSVQDYFDKRIALVNADAEAEKAALQKKLALEKQEPAATPEAQLKKQQQIAAIQTQIDQAEIKRKGDIAQLDHDRQDGETQHAIAMLDMEAKLKQAEGDRSAAAQAGLDAEIARLDDELKKLGKTSEERAKLLASYRSTAAGKIGFENASLSSSTSQDNLNLAIGAVNRQANQGSISGIQAQSKIIQLQKDALPNLRAIGQEMQKQAELSKDPSLVQQAKDYNAQLDDMQASLQHVTNVHAEFVNQLVGQGLPALQNFFESGLEDIHNFGQAWDDLGKAFEKVVLGMIARLISFFLMLSLLKLIAPGAASALEAAGPFGSLKGFDGGGYTGDGPRTKVAGVVHAGEYVWNADVTRRLRPLLESLAGGSMPSIRTPGSYMNGGYVDGAGSNAAVEVNIYNNSGQQVSQTQRTGQNGQQIIDLVIGAVATDIAKGGKTAQAVQQTFGVSRKGVIRG